MFIIRMCEIKSAVFFFLCVAIQIKYAPGPPLTQTLILLYGRCVEQKWFHVHKKVKTYLVVNTILIVDQRTKPHWKNELDQNWDGSPNRVCHTEYQANDDCSWIRICLIGKVCEPRRGIWPLFYVGLQHKMVSTGTFRKIGTDKENIMCTYDSTGCILHCKHSACIRVMVTMWLAVHYADLSLWSLLCLLA